MTKPRRAATQKDVAERAGVSTAVVSYVLNDGPRSVAPRTRERVLDAVDALKYRPDGRARTLRLGSSRTIGVVVPDAANPFFAELASAIEAAAFERGYAALVCTTANNAERELAYVRGMAERRVDGLVFVSSEGRHGLDDLLELEIPVVALDRLSGAVPISTIQTRNELGALLGTQHLIAHGHRNIAFLGGPDVTVTPDRRAGWLEALSRAGLAPAAVTYAPFTFEGGRESVSSILSGDDPATAVLVCSDVQAIGLLKGLDERLLGVPRDIAMISFDGTTVGRFAKPALTTVAQPIVQFAESAVAILLDTHGAVQHLLLDSALQIGGSCGCQSRS
jgi:LacI family transcriptional regulator